jgi:uncharacterized OB-fold protein
MLLYTPEVIRLYKEGIFFDARTLELKYQMPVKRIEKFFDALENGKIFATRCNICRELYFPPQMDCPVCRNNDMSWEEISGNAKLETYTIIETTPTSFQKYGRYVIAIGLLESGVRVLSWLRIDDLTRIKIGMNIILKTEKNDDGGYTYIFEAPEL